MSSKICGGKFGANIFVWFSYKIVQHFAATCISFLNVTTFKILVTEKKFMVKAYPLVTKLHVVATSFVTNRNFFCSVSSADLEFL